MNGLNKNYRRRGVALIELALVLSVLLTLSLLLIQYGIIMNTAVSLTNLSREGVRYAVVNPTDNTPILNYMEKACPGNLNWNKDVKNNVSITVFGGTRTVGSKAMMTVTITYNMSNKLFLPSTMKFPFMGQVNLYNTNYVAKASMLIE